MKPESAYALAARAAQALTMAAAAACVVTRFSLPEQGLFFVFLSLAALQQAGDFGLGYASVQVASRLAVEPGGHRLALFRRRAAWLGWMWLTATAVLVGLAGGVLLGRGEPAVRWIGPWVALVIALWLLTRVNLALSLVEGGRSAAVAWRVRLVQEGAGGAAFVAALWLGAGLWGLALHGVVRAAVGASMLAMAAQRGWRRALASASADATAGLERSIDWRREVWPFQWRIGASALSGFLVFQAINPIVLLQQGSEAAGRFGLSLALMNLLLMTTTAWPISLAARWGGWLAGGEHDRLRRSFRQTLIGSTLLALLLALGAAAAVAALDASGQEPVRRLAARLADPMTTALLLGTGVLHHVVIVLAVLLRAEGREPLLAASLVGGVLTLSAMWFAAGQGSTAAPALAGAAMALFGLIWVLALYRTFVRRVFSGCAR